MYPVTAMRECLNCGGLVTIDFARVFGANDGLVYACPNCTTFHALQEGEAHQPPTA